MRQRLAALRERKSDAPDPVSATADAHYRAAIERMKAAETDPQAPAEDEEYDDDRRIAPIVATMHLVQQSVEPDSWLCNGGLGSMSAFSDSLVVRNNAAVHRMISRLLNDLRAAEIANADRKLGRGLRGR
jgi:hypothetical protein